VALLNAAVASSVMAGDYASCQMPTVPSS